MALPHEAANKSHVFDAFYEAPVSKIKPEGVLRKMKEAGHHPLTDGDLCHIAKCFGVYKGTMMQFIKQNFLDLELEAYYGGT